MEWKRKILQKKLNIKKNKQNEIFSDKIYDIFSKEQLENEKKNIAASTQKIYEHFLLKIKIKA